MSMDEAYLKSFPGPFKFEVRFVFLHPTPPRPLSLIDPFSYFSLLYTLADFILASEKDSANWEALPFAAPFYTIGTLIV